MWSQHKRQSIQWAAPSIDLSLSRNEAAAPADQSSNAQVRSRLEVTHTKAGRTRFRLGVEAARLSRLGNPITLFVLCHPKRRGWTRFRRGPPAVRLPNGVIRLPTRASSGSERPLHRVLQATVNVWL